MIMPRNLNEIVRSWIRLLASSEKGEIFDSEKILFAKFVNYRSPGHFCLFRIFCKLRVYSPIFSLNCKAKLHPPPPPLLGPGFRKGDIFYSEKILFARFIYSTIDLSYWQAPFKIPLRLTGVMVAGELDSIMQLTMAKQTPSKYVARKNRGKIRNSKHVYFVRLRGQRGRCKNNEI